MWGVKGIPRQQFIMWLTFRESLKTRVMLQQRGMDIEKCCVLCGEREETVQHLFFKCSMPADIWKQVMRHAGIVREPKEWRRECRWLMRSARGRNARSRKIRKLIMAAVYCIWAERNKVLHTQQRTPVNRIVNSYLHLSR